MWMNEMVETGLVQWRGSVARRSCRTGIEVSFDHCPSHSLTHSDIATLGEVS